jgi:hypothetical protein
VTDQLIIWGLPLLSLCLAIYSPVLASEGRTGPAWLALLAAWSIWPLLLVIVWNDHSAHGTGAHYYHDLIALFALPFATLIAFVIAIAIVTTSRRRAREANSEDTDQEA